jgi:DNA-binding response OmpR family regulator
MAKILLVEDDPMISEIYERKFETAGFDVKVAATGKEVLTDVKKDHYDLVLLDLVLPEMSGMDVLKEIKQSGKYDPAVKIVIFSNLSEKSEQDKAFELGADGFIPKSQFGPSELVAEVERMINEYGEQDKNEARRQDTQSFDDGKHNLDSGAKDILFIEDEDVFIEMFGKKLEAEGYLISYAKNGALAVKEAIQRDFDLIITDMVVTAMGGEEIITNLKREEKTKNIPIIVLSASLVDEELKKVKDLGVTDYYVKTRITPSDLARRVKEILE